MIRELCNKYSSMQSVLKELDECIEEQESLLNWRKQLRIQLSKLKINELYKMNIPGCYSVLIIFKNFVKQNNSFYIHFDCVATEKENTDDYENYHYEEVYAIGYIEPLEIKDLPLYLDWNKTSLFSELLK